MWHLENLCYLTASNLKNEFPYVNKTLELIFLNCYFQDTKVEKHMFDFDTFEIQDSSILNVCKYIKQIQIFSIKSVITKPTVVAILP